jgi:hypothetical protein
MIELICIPDNSNLLFSHLPNGLKPVLHLFKHLHFGIRPAIYQARLSEKEDMIMKTTISRKTAYIGAGAGLVLFAIFGLMPGSLLGGAMGINIAGWLFGLPLQPGLVARVIVLASMLMGVLVTGIVIVTATSTIGWLVGKVLEPGAHSKETAGEAKEAHR